MLWASSLLFLLSATSALPTFNFSAPDSSVASHHAFGVAFGTEYKAMITTRFAAMPDVERMVKVANSTSAGAALYDAFVSYHDQNYPHAMAELRGISTSSGVGFNQIFIQNINEEFSQCAAQLGLLPPRAAMDDCSDLMLCSSAAGGLCALGHNEDNNKADLGTLVLVRASFGATTKWTAATYAGELSSGAFAFSPTAGFGYTLNWVGPKVPVCPAAGRGFVSRAALAAPSFAAARDLIVSTRASSGHNYQLFRTGSTPPPEILNIEVAPNGLYSVRPIGAEAFFHANQYQTLVVPQLYGNSSLHRLKRAAELPPPKTLDDILETLGDQHDVSYPIYHDVASHQKGDLSDWTIATALIDLSGAPQTMTIYAGNPKNRNVAAKLPLV